MNENVLQEADIAKSARSPPKMMAALNSQGSVKMDAEAHSSWMILATMALTLGIRHGFDLDHLAAIDAMTRTVRERKVLSRFVGMLFSLGHGIVVIGISLILGTGLMQSHFPDWLEGFGQWISVVFLFTFGALNLYSVLHRQSDQTIPVGLKSFLARMISKKQCNPLVIASVGALFAFSFDTFSQIALFSISASVLSGWIFSGILGFLFTIGMMLADGINGVLVSVLVQRADSFSLAASRSLGLAISLFSLIICLKGLFDIFAWHF